MHSDVAYSECVYVCMIIISPHLVIHWLRGKGDELPSAMHVSVGHCVRYCVRLLRAVWMCVFLSY